MNNLRHFSYLSLVLSLCVPSLILEEAWAQEQTCSAAAVPITCGSTARGNIAAEQQINCYSFHGAANDVVAITTDSTEFAPCWTLVGPNMQTVGNDHVGGQEVRGLPATGTYTIQVGGCGGAGLYGLTLEAVSGSLNGLSNGPPTPTCGGADGTQTIHCGQVVTGGFDPVGDTDTYTFIGRGTETVTINASDPFDPNVCVCWELFSPTGGLLPGGGTSPPPGENCDHTVRLVGPGVYTMKLAVGNVLGFTFYCSNVLGQAYNLSLNCPCGNSHLDPGELCDPGILGAACCSPWCDFLSGGVCRPATAPCDMEATCTGEGATCPLNHKPNGTPCNDGSLCTQTDTCQAGMCVGSNPVICALPDQCHDTGVCNPASGQCSNPPKTNGTPCGDGKPCTNADTCQNGVCTGTPVVCPALDTCHLAGTCDHSSGSCSTPIKADDSPCDDGRFCTIGESCTSGVCGGGTPRDCSGAADDCNVGVCNDPSQGCAKQPTNEGDTCDDANACTNGDTCHNGTCGGSAVACPLAVDQCHLPPACDPATGECSSPPAPDAIPCNDHDACTSGDACRSGACASGPTTNCDDGDDCTDDTCAPAEGCGHSVLPATRKTGVLCSVNNLRRTLAEGQACAVRCQKSITKQLNKVENLVNVGTDPSNATKCLRKLKKASKAASNLSKAIKTKASNGKLKPPDRAARLDAEASRLAAAAGTFAQSGCP